MLKLPDVRPGAWNMSIDPPDNAQPQITGVLAHPPASKLAFGTTFIAARAVAGPRIEGAATATAATSTLSEAASCRRRRQRSRLFFISSSFLAVARGAAPPAQLKRLRRGAEHEQKR
jgi:hypothetical protein